MKTAFQKLFYKCWSDHWPVVAELPLGQSAGSTRSLPESLSGNLMLLYMSESVSSIFRTRTRHVVVSGEPRESVLVR